jgi:hypothetical protein
MKYLSLDHGGAVVISEIVAVTVSKYEGIGMSHTHPRWDVFVHLRGGRTLTAISVQARRPSVEQYEPERDEAEGHARAIVRMMLGEVGAGTEGFAVLVNLNDEEIFAG